MKLRGRILGTMNLFGLDAGEVSARDAAVAQALAISPAVFGTESSAIGPSPAVLLSS